MEYTIYICTLDLSWTPHLSCVEDSLLEGHCRYCWKRRSKAWPMVLMTSWARPSEHSKMWHADECQSNTFKMSVVNARYEKPIYSRVLREWTPTSSVNRVLCYIGNVICCVLKKKTHYTVFSMLIPQFIFPVKMKLLVIIVISLKFKKM